MPYSKPLSNTFSSSSRKAGGTVSDSITQRVGIQQVGDGAEEANHDDVHHHALAEFFTPAGWPGKL